MNQVEEFLKSLADFSFENLITPKIIRFLYVLGIVAAFICAFFIRTADGFAVSKWVGMYNLSTSPFVFLFYVIILRVALECLIVVFRLAERRETPVKLGKPKDEE